ncbi:MAG: SGNH/GDSL hydrolase family protein [Actinomycetota bacterium]|jgi:lysophospholipase L1-like esterase|nr:SGNH/GDSL hydrolase family protein [Actinomycetota bacterium]
MAFEGQSGLPPVTRVIVASGVVATVVPAAAATPAPVYQLSLGDSLAAGTGASTPADSYVNLVASHEESRFPGLEVKNRACGGATTNSMIDAADPANAHFPNFPTGTPLGAAETFLRSNPGRVPYVTIDIGGNNVDGCLTSGTVSASCVAHGLALVSSQLPQIVAGLEQAAPAVPIFGMDYYDPFLADTGGPALARASATLVFELNSLLTQVYGANGAVPVDVQGPFAFGHAVFDGSLIGASGSSPIVAVEG